MSTKGIVVKLPIGARVVVGDLAMAYLGDGRFLGLDGIPGVIEYSSAGEAQTVTGKIMPAIEDVPEFTHRQVAFIDRSPASLQFMIQLIEANAADRAAYLRREIELYPGAYKA